MLNLYCILTRIRLFYFYFYFYVHVYFDVYFCMYFYVSTLWFPTSYDPISLSRCTFCSLKLYFDCYFYFCVIARVENTYPITYFTFTSVDFWYFAMLVLLNNTTNPVGYVRHQVNQPWRLCLLSIILRWSLIQCDGINPLCTLSTCSKLGTCKILSFTSGKVA